MDLNHGHWVGDSLSAAHAVDKLLLLPTDEDTASSVATWNRLASNMLTTKWDSLVAKASQLKESTDNTFRSNALAQVIHSTRLSPWTLVVFALCITARDVSMTEYCSVPFTTSLESDFSWVLEYLVIAVVTSCYSNKNSAMCHGQQSHKDLERLARLLGHRKEYPITQFLKALYIDYDFETAQTELQQTMLMLERHASLSDTRDSFVKAASHLICDRYCTVHRVVEIQ
jgi:translation initiation factor 3 subunit E